MVQAWVAEKTLNSLTTIWVRKPFGREQKTPAPSVFYGRNITEITVNNQQNSTTNITTMVNRMPPPAA